MSPPVGGPRVHAPTESRRALPPIVTRPAEQARCVGSDDTVEICRDRPVDNYRRELAATPTRAVDPSPNTTRGQRFAEGGQESLKARTAAHSEAIDRTGIGAYYGSESDHAARSPEERTAWVEANKKPGTEPADPKSTHCLAWSMEHLGAAYEKAGMPKRWAQIERAVRAGGGKGTDLAKELQKDGWRGIYFNPDTKHPNETTEALKKEHSFTAAHAAKAREYYGIRVDGMVTNYRPTEGEGTTLDERGTAKLDQVPFFFGVARGGMHTFVGQEGRVNEFHWDRDPNDKGAIEERKLNEFEWNSGIIMVPPGTWPKM